MLIDLRSDTVTRPTPAMLKAMFAATVGDDVFGEDETVNALEQQVAQLFNHEAALFCPSGTMTNQIAIKVHTQPGDEVICDVTSHIYNYERGGIASNSGVQAKLLNGDNGRISALQIEENINPEQDWLTHTSLVSLENTCNRAGGSYYKLTDIAAISDLCKENNLKLHLDGARIFNALVETGESPASIGNYFDSISVCLSKGLGAPIGSLLIGNSSFIKKARRIRKAFGGGMRQAGYLAAAGIYALNNNISRLTEDHKRAKAIEQKLKQFNFVESILPVKTNIVIFTLSKVLNREDFIQRLAKQNILTAAFGKQTIRFVTHLDFDDNMLERVIQVLDKAY